MLNPLSEVMYNFIFILRIFFFFSPFNYSIFFSRCRHRSKKGRSRQGSREDVLDDRGSNSNRQSGGDHRKRPTQLGVEKTYDEGGKHGKMAPSVSQHSLASATSTGTLPDIVTDASLQVRRFIYLFIFKRKLWTRWLVLCFVGYLPVFLCFQCLSLWLVFMSHFCSVFCCCLVSVLRASEPFCFLFFCFSVYGFLKLEIILSLLIIFCH